MKTLKQILPKKVVQMTKSSVQPPKQAKWTSKMNRMAKTLINLDNIKKKEQYLRNYEINSEFSTRISAIDNTIDSLYGMEKIEALVARAGANTYRECYEPAIKDLSKALKHRKINDDPKYKAEVYHNRATLYARMKQFDKAEEDFKKAIKIQKREHKKWLNSLTNIQRLTKTDTRYRDALSNKKLMSFVLFGDFEDNQKIPLEGSLDECFRNTLGINGKKHFENIFQAFENLPFNPYSDRIDISNSMLIGIYYTGENSPLDPITKHIKNTPRMKFEDAMNIYKQALEDLDMAFYNWSEAAQKYILGTYTYKGHKPKVLTYGGHAYTVFRNEVMSLLANKYPSTLEKLYYKRNWMTKQQKEYITENNLPMECYQRWLKTTARDKLLSSLSNHGLTELKEGYKGDYSDKEKYVVKNQV